MRCFSYSFRGEEELENLLIELWIRLEKFQAAAPQLEIRRNAGARGVLLLWLNDDRCLKALLVEDGAEQLRQIPSGGQCERVGMIMRPRVAARTGPRGDLKSSAAAAVSGPESVADRFHLRRGSAVPAQVVLLRVVNPSLRAAAPTAPESASVHRRRSAARRGRLSPIAWRTSTARCHPDKDI
jgi:hypothetical protein